MLDIVKVIGYNKVCSAIRQNTNSGDTIMSAGQREDHYIQDAGELYFAYRVQLELERSGRALGHYTSTDHYHDFISYLEKKGVSLKKFEGSEYCKNVNTTASPLTGELFEHYGMNFDILCNETESRNQGLKQDVALLFADGTEVGYSLKNYKKGIDRIQACSGTWVSLICNLSLEPSPGVGKCLDPLDGTAFQPGRNKARRQAALRHLGLGEMADLADELEAMKEEYRARYIRDEKASFWRSISEMWKGDCAVGGRKAALQTHETLEKLPRKSKEIVRERIIKMTGLDGKEELIVLGKGKYLCSTTNPQYRDLLMKAQSEDSVMTTEPKNQSLSFLFKDSAGDVFLTVDVPFTLQKNGAWYLPKKEYSGSRLVPKEGVSLEYGERRPKKSKEINTSINTWFSFSKSGVFPNAAV